MLVRPPDSNRPGPQQREPFECPLELVNHAVCGRGSNGVVFDLKNGRVLKVMLVDGRYPVYGRELDRIRRLLSMAPLQLFPNPAVVAGRGVEMDKVALTFRDAPPQAITALMLKAVTLLKSAGVCYTDFHRSNLGGRLDGPGLLLDPDSLCDPWSDPLILGHYSPIGGATPTAIDTRPAAAAALGQYCMIFSACCTALSCGGNEDAVRGFTFTKTRTGGVAELHARLQSLMRERHRTISAPGFARQFAALTDMEGDAYSHLRHIAGATGCLHVVEDAADARPPCELAALCQPCRPQ